MFYSRLKIYENERKPDCERNIIFSTGSSYTTIHGCRRHCIVDVVPLPAKKRWVFMKKVKTTLFATILSFLIGASGMYIGMSFVNGEESMPNNAVADNAGTFPIELPAELDEQASEKFKKAFELISEQYVEGVDNQTLLEGAIEGMLGTLEDPYSVYMDPETAAQFEESLDSHFSGIGAEVSMNNGNVTIVAPFRDSPAERSGLQPNDRIIEIDGESIEGLSLYDAVLKIRGEKGTIVKLTIERPGVTQMITLEIERDEIPIETVRPNTIEHKGQTIGVLEITSFSKDTAEHFEKELKAFEEQGIDGLVIDVRGNPGGYLDVVEEIGKLIIPEQLPIVQIENREGERVRYLSSLQERKDYPIVGLIDGGSASASEILAGALKEAGNYDLVGETTFGKGTVQSAIKLGDGSEIKLSLYKWLTSDGNFINEVGIDPTVEVRQPDYFYLPPITVEEDLEYDMLNEQIRNAQMMLKGLGFEPGRTDGYFGEQTSNAVQAFQERHELPSTGIIDEGTASAIQEQVIELIRDEKNDVQLQTALELIVNGE